MARARNIKPGFFRNADLVELSLEARLLFIGLWTIADRAGRLEDRPKQIKMEIFPADNIDCDARLNDLASIEVIERYEYGGHRYIQIVNFSKHQNPHKDEKASTIPDRNGNLAENKKASCKHGASTVQTPCEEEVSTGQIGLIPDSLNLIPDSIEEPSALVASKLAPCPQQQILDLFAELLPQLPQPRVWEGSREKNLRSRWKWIIEDLKKKGKPCDEASGLDFFRRMFGYISQSDFLMGRSSEWSCPGLHWIVEASNFAKIIEGAYENKVPV